jgi:hypothetical protein
MQLIIRKFNIITILKILVISLWISLFILNVSAVDFYPLFFAARRVKNGQSPYGVEATQSLSQQWSAPFAQGGIAYPLPLILLITPLTFLKFNQAAILWTTSGLLLGFSSLLITDSPKKRLLLPFLFLPFYRALHLGQATVIWFGLEALLLTAIAHKKTKLAGLITAILPLKPQAGLIFALYGLIWAIANKEKTMLLWTMIPAASYTLLSFLIQPFWLFEWIKQIQTYQAIVTPPSILPWALLLVLACWHLPWPARIAAMQVVIFPVSDLYSTLPLLFCWLYLNPTIAIIGTSITWLWSLLHAPSSTEMLWVFVISPLLLASLAQYFIDKYRSTSGDICLPNKA